MTFIEPFIETLLPLFALISTRPLAFWNAVSAMVTSPVVELPLIVLLLTLLVCRLCAIIDVFSRAVALDIVASSSGAENGAVVATGSAVAAGGEAGAAKAAAGIAAIATKAIAWNGFNIFTLPRWKREAAARRPPPRSSAYCGRVTEPTLMLTFAFCEAVAPVLKLAACTPFRLANELSILSVPSWFGAPLLTA